MKISEHEIDPEKAEHGAWVKNIPEMEDLELLVCSFDCEEARKLQDLLIAQIPRARRVGGRLQPKDQEAISNAVLHRVVLRGWNNVNADDGQPIAYSKELAHTYIYERRYKRFREAVAWAASTVAENAAVATEDLVGNSQTTSAGSSTGVSANPG